MGCRFWDWITKEQALCSHAVFGFSCLLSDEAGCHVVICVGPCGKEQRVTTGRGHVVSSTLQRPAWQRIDASIQQSARIWGLSTALGRSLEVHLTLVKLRDDYSFCWHLDCSLLWHCEPRNPAKPCPGSRPPETGDSEDVGVLSHKVLGWFLCSET